LKALDISLEDTKKYIKEVVGTRVENILYFMCFMNYGSLGNIGRTLGEHPKTCFKGNEKHQIGHHGC
jgi:hypothetical protein